MIADTSFLIDLLRKDEDAVEKAEELEEDNRAYSLGSPTVYELWIGVARSDAEEKQEILDIIESQPVRPLEEDSGLKAAKIQRKLMENGDRIGHLNALIAGITAETSKRILTGNEEEFGRVEGLEIETY